jgi:hypothetical protein
MNGPAHRTVGVPEGPGANWGWRKQPAQAPASLLSIAAVNLGSWMPGLSRQRIYANPSSMP